MKKKGYAKFGGGGGGGAKELRYRRCPSGVYLFCRANGVLNKMHRYLD